MYIHPKRNLSSAAETNQIVGRSRPCLTSHPPFASSQFPLCAAHKAVRAASESLVMNETRVHVVITDMRQSDRTHESSVVNVPPGAGLARFRAAALSECCRFVKQPHISRSVELSGCRALTEKAKAVPGVQARRSASWSHRSKDGGTESSSDRLNWGTSGRRRTVGISKETGGEDQKLGCGHSKLRGWRTEQPLAEPRATGRVCGVRSPTCRLDISPTTELTRLAEIATVTASKPALGRRRAQLTARLKPYWGKPAVRNFRGGRGKPDVGPDDRLPRRPKGLHTLEVIGLIISRLCSTRLPPVRF